MKLALLAPTAAVLAATVVLASGCAGAAPPLHLRLATGAAPAVAPADVRLPAGVELRRTANGLWLRTVLDPEAWTPTGLPGVWRQPRRAVGTGVPPAGAAQRLRSLSEAPPDPRSAEWRYVALDASQLNADGIEPGMFCALGDAVFVATGAGDPPPLQPLELLQFLERGADDGVAWRVAVGEVEAEGLPLLTGERATLTLPAAVPAGHALSFWLTARSLSPNSPADAAVELELRLPGHEPRTFPLALDATRTRSRALTVALPALPAGARVEWELTGAPVAAALHQPRVHPADVGAPGARPWGATRPDLALVVADTYRADNLEAYGGAPGVAPELDALAARGRVYARAWAPSPWTLPSHAALFTGLVPPATRCTTSTARLADDAVTLAEELRRVGYRTVAITDRGFVSRDHGLAQGFEWFQEVMRRGEDSLLDAIADARAQLDADDGRPLFLFLQTYRAHTPYEVSAETRRELGARFAFDETYEALLADLPLERMGRGHPRFAEFLGRIEALYRGASRDTSRGLGLLFETLEDRGLLAHGHLFVTSDHGEAFGEHGLYGHGSTVFEPQLRIPLLHVGTGVEPGTEDTLCSLLDLPTTLAALAGLAPPAAWMGSDLRALPADRVHFAFVGDQPTPGHRGAFAARRGDHKLYFEAGEPAGTPWAFDLSKDPAEADDVHDTAPWSHALAERVRAGFDALVAPRVGTARARLSAEARQQLGALGYGVGGEDE